MVKMNKEQISKRLLEITKEEVGKIIREILDKNPEAVDLVKDSFIAHVCGDPLDIVKTTERIKKLLQEHGLIAQDIH